MDVFILVFTLDIMLAAGVSVAYAVSTSAIIGAWHIDIPLEAAMIQLTSGANKFSLLAIPFFILAGTITAEGGIAQRLANFAYTFAGFIRGGLSLVNIVTSAFLDAISGSSVADTMSIDSAMVPEMDRKDHPCDFAAAVTASGSAQAILTPSSHNSVVYSLAAGGAVSIVALLITGVLSGLLLNLSLMVVYVAFVHKRDYPKGERVPFRQTLEIFADTLWGLMTIVVIMDDILSGTFTATESAAIVYLWTFFVTMLIYHDYKWSEPPRLMFRAVKAATIVVILISFATAFDAAMTYMQLPMRITETFTNISDDKYVILMCINIMLLLIDMLMDMAPLILILTPILLPATNALGIDPAHFGMITLVGLGIDLITSPVGSVLSVVSTVSKQRIEQVAKVMLPFYLVLSLVLMLMAYIPATSPFLPKLSGVV